MKGLTGFLFPLSNNFFQNPGRQKTPGTGDTIKPLTSKQYKHNAYEDDQEPHITIEPCASGQRKRKDGTHGRAHKRHGGQALTALVRTALATPASNILSALLWLSLLCASAPQTFALGGIPLWTNRYNGPANSGDLAQAVAVDSSGNVNKLSSLHAA